jgi:hypothetical protein
MAGANIGGPVPRVTYGTTAQFPKCPKGHPQMLYLDFVSGRTYWKCPCGEKKA